MSNDPMFTLLAMSPSGEPYPDTDSAFFADSVFMHFVWAERIGETDTPFGTTAIVADNVFIRADYSMS